MGICDGRGRWMRVDIKATTNDLLNLDLVQIEKSVDLNYSQWIECQWSQSDRSGPKTSLINFWVLPSVGIRLHYSVNDEPVTPYLVPFDVIAQNFGGVRRWFRCPSCDRRCRILYGEHMFLCRKCQNLTYRSSQTTAGPNRIRIVVDNKRRWLHDRLEDLYTKPPRMHWITWTRIQTEYEDLSEISASAYFASLYPLIWGTDSQVEPYPLLRYIPDPVKMWKEYKQTDFDAVARADLEIWLKEDLHARQSEVDQNNRLTLGELAKLTGVSYSFALEVRRAGLLRPDKGRNKRRKRYRRKLATWLRKLWVCREQGLTWAELTDWAKRRWTPGREHERCWPETVKLVGTSE